MCIKVGATFLSAVESTLTKDALPGCVWLSGWRGDVKVLESGALGGRARGCGRTAPWASGWLQTGEEEMIGRVNSLNASKDETLF